MRSVTQFGNEVVPVPTLASFPNLITDYTITSLESEGEVKVNHPLRCMNYNNIHNKKPSINMKKSALSIVSSCRISP